MPRLISKKTTVAELEERLELAEERIRELRVWQRQASLELERLERMLTHTPITR